MKVHYLTRENLILPTKANPTDAGYDVCASTPPLIVGDELGGGFYKRIDYIEYGTNLFVKPIPDSITVRGFCDSTMEKAGPPYHLDLRPRSSISKYNLLLANSPATIDESYRGEIKVRFKYIFQPEDFRIFTSLHSEQLLYGTVNMKKIYQQGDRIVQLLPNESISITWMPVNELDKTERGAGGFGSTGN